MKPSVIMVWPRQVDFPLCRLNLKRFRDYFQDIYIAFSNHHLDGDYTNFIRSDLESLGVTFIDAVISHGGDWRNDAINQLLDKMSPVEHVLFLEQDFLISDKSFLDRVFKEDNDFIYYQERDRIHPAFAVVRKSIIDKTSKNFSVVLPKDHFGFFFDEVQKFAQGKNIDDFGVKLHEDYYHMQGLTQNYKCFIYQDPFFRPQTFFYFNYKSSLLPNQSPFCDIMNQINQFERPKTHEFLDEFFPL
ncbi:hypothetical protein M0R04_14240 [Candidatus Dojkabacteria bacterium]|jgi:hypothetical protein|nr:hypothetical protein [Candidatus Dojkabacteria bacterium]